MTRVMPSRLTSSLRLAVVLGSVGALAACSSTTAADPAAPIESADSVSFLYPTAAAGLSEIIPGAIGEAFAAESGISVEMLTGATTPQAVEQQITADMAGGTAPDMALVTLNSLPTWVAEGVAQPLEGVLDSAEGYAADDAYEEYRSLGDVDGEKYAVPYTLSMAELYYNADVFAAAGLDPEQPPQTYSELREQSEQLVASGAATSGVGWSTVDTSTYTFQSFVSSAGGAFMNDDQTELTIDDSANVEALDYWSEMQSDGLANGFSDATAMTAAFAKGDIGMLIYVSSALPSLVSSAPFDLRLAQTPIPDAATRAVPATGFGIIVLTDDPAKQAAAGEVIAALMNEENQTALATKTGFLTTSRAANESDAVRQLVATDPRRAVVLDTRQYAVPTFQFPGLNATEIWDQMSAALQSALAGAQSAEDALAGVQDSAASLIP